MNAPSLRIYKHNLCFSFIDMILLFFIIGIPIMVAMILGANAMGTDETDTIVPHRAVIIEDSYSESEQTLNMNVISDSSRYHVFNIYGWSDERVDELTALVNSGVPLTVTGPAGNTLMSVMEATDAQGNVICTREEMQAKDDAAEELEKRRWLRVPPILLPFLILHVVIWRRVYKMPHGLVKAMLLCGDIPSEKFIAETEHEDLRRLARQNRHNLLEKYE
ncbi:MAG: hypothetical protein IIY02_06855 [Firmicutes bacterium]|nr:hypothetical protein [Bacillota bacterium]